MNKKVKSNNNLSNNFNKIVMSFKDKWVAVPEDYSQVFASADTLSEVRKKIGSETKNLKFFKVIP